MKSGTAPRVLVVHEWLYTWAGAERVLDEILAVYPDADLVVSFVSDDLRGRYPAAARARELWLAKVPGVQKHHRWFLPLQALAFATLDTRDYDLVISSSHAFAKAVRARPPARHLCYCYSPPRYLWDLQETYAGQASLPQRLALGAMAGPLRTIDRWAAGGVDRFIGISQHVASRVERHYGCPAGVIYPPVDVKPGGSVTGRRGDFLLTLGRLVPYKRVDLAIRAAALLGMRLVIAGEGPERRKLEAIAGPECEFAGSVSEQVAGELLSSCAAFVFCAEEDFGIAPLEANAHGAPVVALRRGAAIETIPEGIAGTFFETETPEAVADAVRVCLRRDWDVGALQANAARFSPDRFRRELSAAVDELLA